MRTTDDEANIEHRPLLLARTIRGGVGDRLREQIAIDADGTFHRSNAAGRNTSAMLSSDQLALITSICASSGFGDLPRFVDGPVSRSDPFAWTYCVDGHEVTMTDPDRAPDAVPPALRTVDAIVEGVAAAVARSAGVTEPDLSATTREHTNVYVTGLDPTNPVEEGR